MKKLFLIIFLLFYSGCREEIAHNLNEIEANRIVARFQRSDVDTKKIHQPDGKWAISVAKEIAAEAITFLESEKLFSGQGSETPLINPLSSTEERSFAIERGTSRTIEETLFGINGVERAKVHLFIPKKDALDTAKREQSESASVLLVTSDEFTLNNGDIAALVGGASGISADRISVIVNKGIAREMRKFIPQTKPEEIPLSPLIAAFISFFVILLAFSRYKKRRKALSFIEER